MVIRVAVTGGIASGKTSLCRFLQDLGASVVSADQIVHHLLFHDSHVQQAIVQLFGVEVVVMGKLSKEKIATLVFGNPEKLEALEALLHPLVDKEIDRSFAEAKGQTPLLIAEIPLLFEAGMARKFNQIVTVFSPSIRAEDKDGFEKRMARQLSPKEKVKRSSIVILNRGSLDDLQREATLLFEILLEISS